MIFYKQYNYAPRATFVSVLFGVIALVFILCAIALFKDGLSSKQYMNCLVAVVLVAAGILTYVYGGRRLPDKIAAKDGPKNIRTKAKYALRLVREHPEYYEQMLRENPDFAAKYVRNENGKIVKR